MQERNKENAILALMRLDKENAWVPNSIGSRTTWEKNPQEYQEGRKSRNANGEKRF